MFPSKGSLDRQQIAFAVCVSTLGASDISFQDQRIVPGASRKPPNQISHEEFGLIVYTSRNFVNSAKTGFPSIGAISRRKLS